MKINWGTGLVIGMLLFMGFIMYFVITMTTDDSYSHDLVTEEYYKKELYYQEEIDAQTNYQALGDKITGKRTEEGWLLQFPSDVDQNAQGTIKLYRPSNEGLDSELELKLDESGQQLIPGSRLVDGIWELNIQWAQDDRSYLYKESIVY